jgi:hypothetical protein
VLRHRFGTTEIGAAAQARSGGSSGLPIAGILPKEEQDQLSNMKAAQARQTPIFFTPPSHSTLLRNCCQVHYDPKIHFDDPRLLEALREGGRQAKLIHEFLIVLSVCHTVIPEIVRACFS